MFTWESRVKSSEGERKRRQEKESTPQVSPNQVWLRSLETLSRLKYPAVSWEKAIERFGTWSLTNQNYSHLLRQWICCFYYQPTFASISVLRSLSILFSIDYIRWILSAVPCTLVWEQISLREVLKQESVIHVRIRNSLSIELRRFHLQIEPLSIPNHLLLLILIQDWNHGVSGGDTSSDIFETQNSSDNWKGTFQQKRKRPLFVWSLPVPSTG